MMCGIGSDFADPHSAQDDIPALALCALEPEEALQARRHLAGCPSCRAEVAVYQAVVGMLCYAIPPQVPSAQLRERILSQIALDTDCCTSTSG